MNSEVVPSDDELAEAWRVFNAATRRLRTRHALDGLSVSQMNLLRPLAQSEGMPVGMLAAQAEIASPTATRMLDGLERDGFVERNPSHDDRRQVLVRLTERGQEMMDAKQRRIVADRVKLFGAMSDGERAETRRSLTRMSRLIDQL
jgi:DNA-binding MarR family transcriptional regulator